MLSIVCALQSLIDKSGEDGGDNIVVVSPIWPNIFQAARIAGAIPKMVRLAED